MFLGLISALGLAFFMEYLSRASYVPEEQGEESSALKIGKGAEGEMKYLNP